MSLRKGLEGHWTLNKNDVDSGFARDSSAYDNHGTINGGQAFTNGIYDTAFFFNGLNGGRYIDIANLDISGGYSYCVWVYPTALNVDANNNYRRLFAGDSGASLTLEESGSLTFRPYSGTTFSSGGDLQTNEWAHVAVTFDGTDRYVYVNGSQVDSYSESLSGNITTMTISTSNGDHQYKGSMQDARLYNRPLSVEEVNQIYNARRNRATSVKPFLTRPMPSDSTNLMDSSVWSPGTGGSQGNFSRNGTASENDIVLGVSPYGHTAPLWYGRSEDTDSNGDGGWNYNVPQSEIDNSFKYRQTVWVKQEFTSGTVYHGTDNANNNVEDFSGTAQGNPYYWSGDLPTMNEWYLIVGYIQPAGSSSTSEGAIYDTDGNRVTTITDYRWVSSISGDVRNRSYYYYDTNVGRGAYFFDPRFEKCDGSQPSLHEILTPAQSREPLETGLVGHFVARNNFTNGSDLYDRSPQGVDATGSGTITTTTGKLHRALDADGNSVTWDNQAFRDAVANADYAVCMWIKQDDQTSNSDWVDVIQWDDGTTKQSTKRIERGSASASSNQDYWINLGMNPGNSKGALSRNNIGIANGVWWHLGVVVDSENDEFTIYVNGSQDRQSTVDEAEIADPGTITINVGEYGGDVEDIRFYKRALTQEEIQTLYERGNQ